MPKEFFQILPKIAEHPLAILAYLCLLGGWLLWFYRRNRSKDFLKALERIPKPERSEFSRKAGYKYDELSLLPQQQRLKFPTQRYRLIAYIVAVIAFVLIVLAAFKVYRESQNDWKVKYDELLKISEATGAALNKFRIRIEGARATADTAGRLMDNPELRRLGAELAQATDEFDARYRSQQTPEMALQIRLARARAAIAEGRFADAQELVSDADLAAQTMTTVNMLLVRADASFGLGHWDSAKEYYERVLSINPTHIGAFFGAGNSALALRKYDEAASIWDRLIRVVGESDSFESKRTLANALLGRAQAYFQLNELTKAVDKYNQAFKLWKQLRDANQPLPVDNIVRAFIGRGMIYSRLGQSSNAIADCSQAIDGSEKLDNDGHADFAYLFAAALNSRASVLSDFNRPADAVSDYNRAIEILKSLIKSSQSVPTSELTNALASAFNNRGVAYQRLGLWTNAIEDHSQAIYIRELLVKAGHAELASDLASAYDNRGVGYKALGKLSNAITNNTMAIDIWEPLVKSAQPDLAYDLLKALNNRGLTYKMLGQLTNAISDQRRAVEIEQDLVEKNGMVHLRADLEKRMSDLIDSLLKDGRREEAQPFMDKAFSLNMGLPLQNSGVVVSNNFFSR